MISSVVFYERKNVIFMKKIVNLRKIILSKIFFVIEFFLFEKFFCEKRNASTPLCNEKIAFREHSTGNQKVLSSIPSGVEAFLFSQKKFSKYIENSI